MTIDVPLGDMGQALLATNQLTTIDQSELSAQLGLGLVGGAMLEESQSPDNRLSPAASPTSSLQDDDMDDFSRVSQPFWMMSISMIIWTCYVNLVMCLLNIKVLAHIKDVNILLKMI